MVPYTAKDGTTTYRIRLRVNGKQTTETFLNPQAAEIFRLRVIDPNVGPERAVMMREREDTASGDYVPTLAEMLDRHISGLSGVDQRTPDDYLALARRSWLPALGSLRVDEVQRRDIAGWVNAQSRKGSAPKTIRNAHSVLSAVLTSALHDGHLTVNPAQGTRLPRAGEEHVEDIRFLSYPQFDILFPEFTEPWQPMVTWMFGMGTRYSETTAAQPQDLNLAAGQWQPDGTFTAEPTVRIVRAWKKGNRIGPPKSKASRRTLVIPTQVLDAIEPLLKNLPSTEYIFRTRQGRPVRHSNFYNRVWLPATIRASCCADHQPAGCKCRTNKPWECAVHVDRDTDGDRIWLPPCSCTDRLPFRPRIHDARHTHASWLIAQGARLEVVQERLGHEDYLTTRRVYGHLMPDARRQASDAAAMAFAATKALGG